MNSYARFFENLQQDLKAFIYWCLVFTVFRIAFIAIYNGQLNGEYGDGFIVRTALKLKDSRHDSSD